ncbi:MAG: extensin family protein [Rhodomicrobium sp.]
MRPHELKRHAIWLSAFALSSMFVAGSGAAGIHSPVRALAGLGEAKSPAYLPIRHRFRHHRRRGLERHFIAQVHGAADANADRQTISQPAAPEAAKAPAQDGSDRQAGAPPEPLGPPPPPETWTPAEIENGRMDCKRRLSGLHVLFDAADPIREGVCGLPAPIRLKGFEYEGKSALMFSPVPVVSCKLAEALRRWTGEVLEPAAKTHLQTRIVGIATLSAYHCRTRYDDPAQRISQHAFANALDVSEFVTEKGDRIGVLDDWNAAGERSAFLHAIHAGACKIFGTTLGPEANVSHKNHFHLDMKERRHPLCDFTAEQVRAREEAKKKAPETVPVSGGDKPSAATSETKPIPVPAAR